MKNNFHIYIRYLLIITIAAFVGCSSESGPVSLPTPFSGSLTLDTQVIISDGAGITGGGSGAALKSQTNGSSITWQNFDPVTGASSGETTFFLDTLTTPIITQAEGGVRREYTLSACVSNGCGFEVCSDNFHCFEYPTNFDASFDVSTIAPDDPAATPVLRKAICSGNNITNGELIDGKYVLEMAQLSNGDFRFGNQSRSSMWIHAAPPCSPSGSGDVVYTILTQGFSTLVPSQEELILTNPLFLPGLPGERGTESDFVKEERALTADLLDIVADIQLCISTSCLLVEDVHFIDHGLPEIFDVFAETIRRNFSTDPLFSETLFDGAFIYFVVAEKDEDQIPIDCSLQTGFFKNLCEEQGALKLNYRCLIMLNPNTLEVFTLEGMWVLSKDN